jgi:uncharacterized membrane protein YphA (DoxX/SURF4 family)
MRRAEEYPLPRSQWHIRKEVARTGLSLLLGYHPTIGVALLVIFLLGVSFGIHNFWTVQDPQSKLGEMTNFLKNVAILGLLLMTLAIPQPWLMSLGR